MLKVNNPQYQSLKDKLDICIEFIKSYKSQKLAEDLRDYTRLKIKSGKFKLSEEDNKNIEFINSLIKHIIMEKEVQNDCYRTLNSNTGSGSAFRGLSK